jgi:hypothetical protein
MPSLPAEPFVHADSYICIKKAEPCLKRKREDEEDE